MVSPEGAANTINIMGCWPSSECCFAMANALCLVSICMQDQLICVVFVCKVYASCWLVFAARKAKHAFRAWWMTTTKTSPRHAEVLLRPSLQLLTASSCGTELKFLIASRTWISQSCTSYTCRRKKIGNRLLQQTTTEHLMPLWSMILLGVAGSCRRKQWIGDRILCTKHKILNWSTIFNK